MLERKSVLEKANMQQKDKEKWLKVLKVDMMSSEESENDDMIIKPLEWRSGIVNRFLLKLDEKALELKSPQAKRQRKTRMVSKDYSLRDIPKHTPSWAITASTAAQQ